MTADCRYHGLAVSEGIAVGEIYLGDTREAGPVPAGTVYAFTVDQVRAAFTAVSGQRAALAAELRTGGADLQAGIVEIGALIAADPALIEPALDAMRGGASAVSAISDAAASQAALLEALPDPDLAQRAGDVRQVAAAVLDLLRGAAAPPPPAGPFILVRHDVDPADLIRMAGSRLAGAVSVGGGASSHAAIIARGLGLPMLAGADPAVLGATAGRAAILDAGTAGPGELVIDPSDQDLAAAATAGSARPASRLGDAPVRTADGELVTLLCNVASAAETRLGLSGGAAGAGLVRTEIPFTGAVAWPSESEHLARLGPVLAQLDGRTAVVRLLDFSGDKVPPFLAGRTHGLTALLGAPDALDAQLRAIVRAGARTRLAVLIPMVTSLDEVSEVRGRLAAAAAQLGTDPPDLGIMVEVAATAARAGEFAPAAGLLSIGTNDLTSEVLSRDRADPGTRPALAADPRVLALIEHVVNAGTRSGAEVCVCGDAAADPDVLPLLLGLGVRTVSVGAARVPLVANAIAATDTVLAADRVKLLLESARRAGDTP